MWPVLNDAGSDKGSKPILTFCERKDEKLSKTIKENSETGHRRLINVCVFALIAA